MAHTPGPWIVDIGRKAGFPRTFILDSRPTDPGDPDAGGPIIAELWDAEPDILAADARLIAASPKMLEVLQHISRACEPGIDQSDDELELFIANVRKLSRMAIDEATL